MSSIWHRRWVRAALGTRKRISLFSFAVLAIILVNRFGWVPLGFPRSKGLGGLEVMLVDVYDQPQMQLKQVMKATYFHLRGDWLEQAPYISIDQ